MSFDSFFQLVTKNFNNQTLEFLLKCTPWLVIPYVSLLFYGPTLHKILPNKKIKQLIKKIRNYIVITIYFFSITINNLFFIWGIGYFLGRISNENTYMSIAISILGMGLLFLLVVDLLLYQLSPSVLDSRSKYSFPSHYFLLNYVCEKLAAPFSCYLAVNLIVDGYYEIVFPGITIWIIYHLSLFFIRCDIKISNQKYSILYKNRLLSLKDLQKYCYRHVVKTYKKHLTLLKINYTQSFYTNSKDKRKN